MTFIDIDSGATNKFLMGFTARLVASKEPTLYQNADWMLPASKAVIDAISAEISDLQVNHTSSDWSYYKWLVQLRNHLQTRSFGEWLGTLHWTVKTTSLHLPQYTRLTFEISSEFAKSFLEEYPERQRTLITNVVDVFLKSRDEIESFGRTACPTCDRQNTLVFVLHSLEVMLVPRREEFGTIEVDGFRGMKCSACGEICSFPSHNRYNSQLIKQARQKLLGNSPFLVDTSRVVK